MKKYGIAIVVVMMSLCIIGGFYLLDKTKVNSKSNSSTSTPTAYIEGNEVKVSFKLDGRIEELFVDVGDFVEKGQVIGTLQNGELEAKVAQEEASVQLAEGKVKEAEGALSTAEAKKGQSIEAVDATAESIDKQIAQAEAAVKAAQANLEAVKNSVRPEQIKQAESQMNAAFEAQTVAKNHLDRYKELLKNGLASQAEVDQANIHYQEAKAKYEVAKEQYEMAIKGPSEEQIKAAEAQVEQANAALQLAISAKNEVSIRQKDIEVADAGIQQALGAVLSAQSGKSQAEAALKEANTYLSYTKLIAPADGVITTKSATVGELVSAGFPVFTLEESDLRWSIFYFPENEVVNMEIGDKVTLQLLATGEELEGTIASIAPAADFAIQKATQNIDDVDIRSFNVKVEYPSLPDYVKTGMTVQWISHEGER
ncbi:HlyD family secretion protein [Ureibacillus thermosphaericus]|uniref:HlyD family secretion protein n=1 Tax=Ureibacillus thermosphaericus TaxID=51173 RepID=UPI0030C994ED